MKDLRDFSTAYQAQQFQFLGKYLKEFNHGFKFGNDRRGDHLAYPDHSSDSYGGDGGGSGFPVGHGGPVGPFLGNNKKENRGFLLRGANMKLPEFKTETTQRYL